MKNKFIRIMNNKNTRLNNSKIQANSQIYSLCNEVILVWSAQSGNPVGASLSGTTSGAATVTFSNTAYGMYNFIFTDGSCSDTMMVTVNPLPVVSSVNVSCIGITGTANITVNATVPIGTLEYSIDGGTYQSSNSYSALANGNHSVVARLVGTTCTTSYNFTINCPTTNPCNLLPFNIIQK